MKLIDVPFNLELLRFSSGEASTLGALYICNEHGKKFTCFTLEDRHHFEKIPGETRIPAGTYKLELRKEGGFHQKYKKLFPDVHSGMIHVLNVPNYEYILIHCGNTDKNTKGCILVGDTLEQNATKKGFLGASRTSYERVYSEIVKGLNEDSYIKIIDWDDV